MQSDEDCFQDIHSPPLPQHWIVIYSAMTCLCSSALSPNAMLAYDAWPPDNAFRQSRLTSQDVAVAGRRLAQLGGGPLRKLLGLVQDATALVDSCCTPGAFQ